MSVFAKLGFALVQTVKYETNHDIVLSLELNIIVMLMGIPFLFPGAWCFCG